MNTVTGFVMKKVGWFCCNNMKSNKEIRADVGDDDRVDALPEKPFYTCWDCLFSLGSIGAFYFDVFTDIGLTWDYFDQRHYLYFALTMCFVIFPALLTNIVSIKWYVSDSKKKEIPRVSSFMWSLRVVFHLFLMGPAWRSIESMHFGFKSIRSSDCNRKEKYYAYMTLIDADNSLVKLLEAFTEAAPQLVLQLFILITQAQVFCEHVEIENDAKPTETNSIITLQDSKAPSLFQILSISSALMSLSLSMTLYARNSRISQQKKLNISMQGSLFIFCWRLFTVGARVLALSLFASVFPNLWFLLVLMIRWIVMSTWIIMDRAKLFKNSCLQHGFELFLGLVYLFAYVSVKNGPTKRKYLIYYSYEVIEDTILVAVWAGFVDPTFTNFYWTSLMSYFGGVLLGLTCMFVYYTEFHPNGSVNDIDVLRLSDETKQNGKLKNSEEFSEDENTH